MRAFIAFVPCWVLYWLGDLLSKVLLHWDASAPVLHPIYSRLIWWSSDLQMWAGATRGFPFFICEAGWPEDWA
jgi:hypothetical protein